MPLSPYQSCCFYHSEIFRSLYLPHFWVIPETVHIVEIWARLRSLSEMQAMVNIIIDGVQFGYLFDKTNLTLFGKSNLVVSLFTRTVAAKKDKQSSIATDRQTDRLT